MRSLEEVWNRIGVVETQNLALKATVTAQQQQIRSLQLQNSLLLENASLSWKTMTVDASTADVGEYSSIAVSPAGLIAIAYFDNTTDDLKIAQYDGKHGS